MPRQDYWTTQNVTNWVTTANTAAASPVTFNPTKAYYRYDLDFITKDQFEYMIEQMYEKIYKILTEHIQLDISEEEFMNILKGD